MIPAGKAEEVSGNRVEGVGMGKLRIGMRRAFAAYTDTQISELPALHHGIGKDAPIAEVGLEHVVGIIARRLRAFAWDVVMALSVINHSSGSAFHPVVDNEGARIFISRLL